MYLAYRLLHVVRLMGLVFDVVPSTFEENIDKSLLPIDYVRETAKQKALEVAQRLCSGEGSPDLIISADTVVTQDNQIFEKPKDYQDAYNMLMRFSGRKHSVCTGVTLLCPVNSSVFTGSKIDGYEDLLMTQFHESTDVIMANLTPDIVNAYIDTGECRDKAGGYGIQGIGASLVEGITGDFYNVMGFPLHRFCKEMLEIYNKK
ncbi:probable bifunctional dTTP/UTP pyrophosphatase/methyltransferase protein isoform X2 [Ylistrum balloti]|uniref:probable bifunctional dTTP/UTP pyrophosphatase/methyltransferase protein isoform X2 n=1 Tax=Ylistrum balloti TaxID=509963 RepID=UPI002905CDB3|nr:probable bifunctional dTTP/UTP pyrophosphatase/methyltransferase protein isoform X2 [Ylistrum balloti]